MLDDQQEAADSDRYVIAGLLFTRRAADSLLGKKLNTYIQQVFLP